MSKSVHDDVLDAALNYIKTNGDRLCVCSAQPTTYTQATDTYMLAYKDISSSNYTGPANGDTSGRKLTINAQDSVDIDSSGDATHLCPVDTTNEKLLYTTTMPVTTLVAGNYINIPAWDIELLDPE